MKENLKEKIRHYLQEQTKKSFSVEEVAAGLGLQKSADFKALVQTVAAMEREGSLLFTKRKTEITRTTSAVGRYLSRQ